MTLFVQSPNNTATARLLSDGERDADVLLEVHRFEFPASVRYFVCSTADKKDNKVNGQTPTREKYTGNEVQI